MIGVKFNITIIYNIIFLLKNNFCNFSMNKTLYIINKLMDFRYLYFNKRGLF